ncbi:MAG: hypothetical protein ACHREM_25750 [Polyangiales bacterium]
MSENAHEETSETRVDDITELLVKLAHHFRLRFGRLEVIFHDGRPAPRVVVEHRIQHVLEEAPEEPRRLPARRGHR